MTLSARITDNIVVKAVEWALDKVASSIEKPNASPASSSSKWVLVGSGAAIVLAGAVVLWKWKPSKAIVKLHVMSNMSLPDPPGPVFPPHGFNHMVDDKVSRTSLMWESWKSTVLGFEKELYRYQSIDIMGNSPLPLFWFLGRRLEQFQGDVNIDQGPRFQKLSIVHLPRDYSLPVNRLLDVTCHELQELNGVLLVAVNILQPVWLESQLRSLRAFGASRVLTLVPKSRTPITIIPENFDQIRCEIYDSVRSIVENSDIVSLQVAVYGPKSLAFAMGFDLCWRQVKESQAFLDWNGGDYMSISERK